MYDNPVICCMDQLLCIMEWLSYYCLVYVKKTEKSHVLLLMKINYPCIVWNNVPKFHENRDSRFWTMRQSVQGYQLWGQGRIN